MFFIGGDWKKAPPWYLYVNCLTGLSPVWRHRQSSPLPAMMPHSELEPELTHILSYSTVLEWWHGSTLAGRTQGLRGATVRMKREDGTSWSQVRPTLSLIISLENTWSLVAERDNLLKCHNIAVQPVLVQTSHSGANNTINSEEQTDNYRNMCRGSLQIEEF